MVDIYEEISPEYQAQDGSDVSSLDALQEFANLYRALCGYDAEREFFGLGFR
jgi:hypothetical protein